MSRSPADDAARTVGLVPVVGRERIAHERLGGRTLVDLAVDLAARRCGAVHVVDADATDAVVRDWLSAASRVVVHDPLCPFTPAKFFDQLAARPEPALVAVRPVVDTLKAVHGEIVVQTVERDRLRIVASPIVVSAELLAGVSAPVEALADSAVLVARLRALSDVLLVEAPAPAMRIGDVEDLRVLEVAQAVRGLA
jgi:2-C-methyl-D-erythritol 4-phosphate cytidylyltransferase